MAVRDEFLREFSLACRKRGENVAALCVSDEKIVFGVTYSDLERVSDELCRYLTSILDQGTRYVGVELVESFFLPCIITAIWKGGWSFAGTGSQYPLDWRVVYLNQLGVKYMILDEETSRYGGVTLSSFAIGQQRFYLSKRQAADAPSPRLDFDICYGIMTSGTTGQSKRIQVPWSCILPNVKELAEEFGVNETDCIFLCSPYTFDPFFIELFFALLTGASLLIVTPSLKLCPSRLLTVLFKTGVCDSILPDMHSPVDKNEKVFNVHLKPVKRKPVTLLQVTPSILKRWQSNDIGQVILSDDSPLRVLLLGGEPFPNDILTLRSSNNKTRIFNIYGITEMSCWACLNEVTAGGKPNALGKPLGDICCILNDRSELLIGSSSRICLIDDERPADPGRIVFRNTGDVVKMADGHLYYGGRTNRIVKKFGLKVDLQKVEESFESVNESLSCAAVFDNVGSRLGLFYLGKSFTVVRYEDFVGKGFRLPEDELKDAEWPDYLIELPEFPVNAHGKQDGLTLVDYLRRCISNREDDRNVREEFQRVWNEVLGSDGSHKKSESFVQLGGNSIKALQVVGRLEDVGVRVPPELMVHLLGSGNWTTCFKTLMSGCQDSVPKKRLKLETETGGIRLSVKWKVDFGKCIDATPTLTRHKGYDAVIVGSHSSKFSSVNVVTGETAWTLLLGDRIESGLAVTEDGSKGFVGCYDCFVYCISLKDGSILWKLETGDMVKSTPCLSSDGTALFVASYDKCLYCLSVEDGKLIRKLELSTKGIYSSGLVSRSLNTFYIATLDGICVGVCERGYDVKWRTKMENPVFASPCLLDHNRILFAEVVGRIHCLNAVDGVELWNYTAGNLVYSTPVVHEWDGLTCITFGCHDGHVYSLQVVTNPVLRWRTTLDSPVFSRVSVFRNERRPFFVAATTKGFLYLCDFSSGTILTSLKLNGELFSSPIVADQNLLFIGCRDNHLYSIEMTQTWER